MRLFRKKDKKKVKKGNILENLDISKIFQKCTKFENILKKGSLKYATVGYVKQLEYAPTSQFGPS